MRSERETPRGREQMIEKERVKEHEKKRASKIEIE